MLACALALLFFFHVLFRLTHSHLVLLQFDIRGKGRLEDYVAVTWDHPRIKGLRHKHLYSN